MFQPLQEAVGVFLSYVPQLIGAIVILIVGYIIARILQAAVTRVLKGVGFEDWMERGASSGSLTRPRPRRPLLAYWAR